MFVKGAATAICENEMRSASPLDPGLAEKFEIYRSAGLCQAHGIRQFGQAPHGTTMKDVGEAMRGGDSSAPLSSVGDYPITRNKTVCISLSTVSTGELGVGRPSAILENQGKDEGKPGSVEENRKPHEEEVQSAEPIPSAKFLSALPAAEPVRELPLVERRQWEA